MRHGGHSGDTRNPCASCSLQNGRLSELREHRSEKSVGNREIASNRVQKKYHRSLTPLAWLETSGGTALSMDPMAEGMVSNNQVFQSAVSHLQFTSQARSRIWRNGTSTRRQNPRKLSSAGAWSWVEKANIGMRGAGDEFHGFIQLDEWLNCRK